MRFDLVSVFGNQLILMIIAVAIGLLIGRRKIGKVSMGTSGTLFVGLFIGWGVHRLASTIVEAGEEAVGYAQAQQLIKQGIVSSDFFNMFLILFVTSVGLLAAKDIAAVLKKYGMRFIVLGLLVTFVGAASTYAFAILSPGQDSYQVAGVYTGALTSSPGLGAAIETAKRHAGEEADTLGLTGEEKIMFIRDAEAGVGVGNAIAYPFGVLMVILGMNFIPKMFRMDMDEEKRRFAEEMQAMRADVKTRDVASGKFNLMTFMMVALVGYLVGSVEVSMGPLGYFTLGSTGGALIMALFLGYVGKLGIFHFKMDTGALWVMQNYSLAFFLAIVGLKYGYRVMDAIRGAGLYLAFVSIAVAFASMLVAYIIGRHILKLNWVMLAGAICGGMTSTPGLGSAVDSIGSDDPAAGYGATYPFALLGMVIFSTILHSLPY